MLLGDGEYDMESGEVEQLFWLQVYLDYTIIVYRNASCVLYAQIWLVMPYYFLNALLWLLNLILRQEVCS